MQYNSLLHSLLHHVHFLYHLLHRHHQRYSEQQVMYPEYLYPNNLHNHLHELQNFHSLSPHLGYMFHMSLLLHPNSKNQQSPEYLLVSCSFLDHSWQALVMFPNRCVLLLSHSLFRQQMVMPYRLHHNTLLLSLLAYFFLNYLHLDRFLLGFLLSRSYHLR